MAASPGPRLKPIASEALRSIFLLAVALVAIFVLLPAALMAAGP